MRYLVAPGEAGSVKTRLLKKLLPALNAAPDKVLFPKGANRLVRGSVRALRATAVLNRRSLSVTGLTMAKAGFG